jgi:hypothetical protein
LYHKNPDISIVLIKIVHTQIYHNYYSIGKIKNEELAGGAMKGETNENIRPRENKSQYCSFEK